MEVADAKGRKITVSPLDPADMLDLLEAAGDASANSGYIRYAMVVCSVSMIDSLPIPRPAKKADIRALAKRLDNDGFAAVASALFGKDDTNTVETAKN